MRGQPFAALQNEHVRSALLLVAFLSFLLVATDVSATGVALLLLVLGGTLAVQAAVDAFDLPAPADRAGFGVIVATVGALLAADESMLVGATVGLAGLWVAADALTAIRYEAAEPDPAFLRGLDDDSGEVMLRMQTLNVVYEALKDADGPRTPDALADDLDLTATRVEDALAYLETKNYVDRGAEGYRATPPRWEKLDPVLRFATWLPRRLARPLTRVATHGAE